MRIPPLPFLLALLSSLFVLTGFAEKTDADDFIDDRQLLKTFTDKMEVLEEKDKLVNEELAKSLRNATNKLVSVELLNPDAEETGKKKGKRKRKPGKKMKAQAFYETMRPYVFSVGEFYKCNRCPHWHTSVAGGFPITKDGVFVTNYHVLETENDLSEGFGVMSHDGKVFPVTEVLAANKLQDVAIFRVDAGDHTFEPLTLAKNPEVGDIVRCISHPNRRFYSFTEGKVSRFNIKHEEGEKVMRMAITAEYAKGSSGSPILDERGQVVGMVAETNAVTYPHSRKKAEVTQMVVRSAVPVSSIWDLFDD